MDCFATLAMTDTNEEPKKKGGKKMRENFKKFLCVVTALMLVTGIFPVTAEHGEGLFIEYVEERTVHICTKT